MCIILFAYRMHPKYQLIVAANRDEFYGRPSAPLTFWNDEPEVLAGRDLVEMGTWMGITRSGRFAALTNFRQPHIENGKKQSRGKLVKDFLISEDTPFDYLKQVQKDRALYNGFNLLVGDINRLYYYSAQENKIDRIQPGFYGLSNAALNTNWPKVKDGVKRLEGIIQDQNSLSREAMFEMLANAERADDSLLPNTGVGMERERLLSSIFIESPDYGTRSSSILTIDHQNNVEFTERTFQLGKLVNEVHHAFHIHILK